MPSRQEILRMKARYAANPLGRDIKIYTDIGMTGTRAKKLSQISWSTSSTGYPGIDTRIDTKTTQGKPFVFSSIIK